MLFTENLLIMKQTLQVNIGSRPFTLDEDAYQVLRDYFADVRSRLPESAAEIVADLEIRMGEILGERVGSPLRVVSLELVRAAIGQLGTPDCFGECPEPDTQEPPRKLYRSRSDRSIAGVCGGVAAYLNLDSAIVRLATLFGVLFGGTFLVAYAICWIVLPEEPKPAFAPFRRQAQSATD